MLARVAWLRTPGKKLCVFTVSPHRVGIRPGVKDLPPDPIVTMDERADGILRAACFHLTESDHHMSNLVVPPAASALGTFASLQGMRLPSAPVRSEVVAPTPPTESPEVTAMRAQLAALKLENETLAAQREADKAAKARNITIKIGEKGGVVVSGLGRFPTTLYADQWPLLLAAGPTILAFIDAHKAELKFKP